MNQIDARTVELSPAESLVEEIHALLLDQGYSQGDALILLRGSRVPDGCRTPTPLLDHVLTPEFAAYLSE